MSISRWISESPSVVEAYDTTRPDFEAYVDEIDAWYQRRPATYSGLDETGRREGDVALAFRIALKIAESRRIVRKLGTPVTITLLNPVYKETGRMQRREDHPHGEDSIRYKIRPSRPRSTQPSVDRSLRRHRRRVPQRVGKDGRSDPARLRGGACERKVPRPLLG
jgi:hypothetical protein